MDAYKLFENTPAERFEDAHLLGNGSLGASVYGGVQYEKILINHDTLWSGQENDKISSKTLPNFPKARALVLEGKPAEATRLINNEMLGGWCESFMPLGHLHLTMGHTTDMRPQNQKRWLLGEYGVSGYSRTLTLEDAVERISYEAMGCKYERTLFVSKPDNVLVIKISASGAPLNFTMAMDSPLRHEQIIDGGAAVIGRAPDRAESYEPAFRPETVYKRDETSDAIRFAAVARVADTDGDVEFDAFRVYVKNASYAVVLMSAATNYAGFRQKRDRDAERVLAECERNVKAAAEKGYAQLLSTHIREYQSLYGRFHLDLGEEVTGMLPTTERFRRMPSVDDPSMLALILQYVRYLLIAFSRPGTEAGNLQGIWNPDPNPVWASNYTTNINVEMNYWPAEPLNLSDCHEPMMDLVRECAQAGRTAAEQLYGLPGWVTHHNTDIWRFSALAGEDASWSWWAFGGFWMCQHLWQHYEYTLDQAFLKDTVYPVLHSAAEFLCAFVVKDADGFYVTAPSTSPENKFFIHENGLKAAVSEIDAGNRMSPNREDTAEVCKASTMDIAIIRELFTNLMKTIRILDIEDALVPRMEEILKNLMPFKIGKTGALQEWDQDYDECTPGMGHVSHLYTIYPSEVITEDQPELFEAARQSLIRRTRHGQPAETDWPAAWKISLYARFQDGEECGRLCAALASNFGANMLTIKNMQIDAIMGWGAGLSEMLLQSHNGKIRLLPAIAPSWRNGHVAGMRTRGGLTVEMKWQDLKLAYAVFTAEHEGSYRITYQDKEVSVFLKAGARVRMDDALDISPAYA